MVRRPACRPESKLSHPHQQSAAPTLSAIICCYTSDRAALLTRAIAATRAQLLDVDELVVVVDHNDDLLTSLRARFSTDQSAVTVVASAGPRGLSGARNTGTREARGDILVFIDDDAEPVPGSFAAVRSRFADDIISALGGAVDAQWLAPRPTWFPEEFGWVVGCDYLGLPGHGAQIRNPIGAAMAVRRDRLEAVGGFSTALGRHADLPAGCEETLMGIALRQQFPDSTILRDTDFRVRHAVSPDRARFSYFARRCYEEGRSKATLSRLTSTDTALSTERGYATRTLPLGAWRSRRTPTRVAALIAGLLVTCAGFGAGTLKSIGRGAPATAYESPREVSTIP